ncbi:kinase-like domain-containing protein [Mycena vulgaris]|nr:kinase-like domain-containing protein [Mycena vulgaris]
MAPEMIQPTNFGLDNFAHTQASDIYAFGCVCLELYTGHPPFADVKHDTAVLLKVLARDRPPRPTGNIIPDHMWDLILVATLCRPPEHPGYATIQESWNISSRPEESPTGWFASVIAPFNKFIDKLINPRSHYLDLQEFTHGPGGTPIYVARLAEAQRDQLTLPNHVEVQDQHDLLLWRPTFVAIKTVLVIPGGSSQLDKVLCELQLLRDIRCDHILGIDALYVDPFDGKLWIRMELMTRTLSSVIELNTAGLVLSDSKIAGCAKDILTALDYLERNDITPNSILAENVLINAQGFLKLTKLANAVIFSSIEQTYPSKSAHIVSAARALGALVWEMAGGHRPPLDEQTRLQDYSPLPIGSRTPVFQEFIQLCVDPSVGKAGYRRLIESDFIRNACERPILIQLLVQCSAFQADG